MIVILKSSLKTSFPRLNATYCEVTFRLLSLEVTRCLIPTKNVSHICLVRLWFWFVSGRHFVTSTQKRRNLNMLVC